jgi:hypothetical protein
MCIHCVKNVAANNDLMFTQLFVFAFAPQQSSQCILKHMKDHFYIYSLLVTIGLTSFLILIPGRALYKVAFKSALILDKVKDDIEKFHINRPILSNSEEPNISITSEYTAFDISYSQCIDYRVLDLNFLPTRLSFRPIIAALTLMFMVAFLIGLFYLSSVPSDMKLDYRIDEQKNVVFIDRFKQ